jgi:diguanylate cyclase (GGDEF)-like protein
MIDADELKAINDKHGHLAGTQMIRQMAKLITSIIRKSDICARYGGDEFVILFTETDRRDVTAVVERIVAGMAATPFDFEGKKLFTTLSAGIAGYPEDGPDVRTVMANADQAMYESKRTGKNRVTVFDKIKQQA